MKTYHRRHREHIDITGRSAKKREYSLCVDFHQPNHDSLVKGQRQALLVTGAGPYDNNADPVFTAFGRLQNPHMAIHSGELFIGSCSTPDKLGDEVKMKAVEFARKITLLH